MMNDISLLKKLLNPDALFDIGQDQKKVRLFETTKNYGVWIRNWPNNTLVIKADKFPRDKIINCKNNSGVCKRADYILVNEYETVFVELKHGRISGKKYIKQQLMGAQCLMDYLISIGRRFFNHDHFLRTASTKQYFVAITDFKRNKRPTQFVKQQNHESNNSPEKMLCLKAGRSDLYYQQFFSGSA